MAKGKGDKVYTLKDYFVNPDADPIKAITALKGEYDHTNFISGVDAAVRGTFTLSTSVLKGTYRATLGTTKFINDITGANKKIVTAMETLIGTENTDNFFSYTDEVKKDAVRMYREIGKSMANFATGKDKARPSEIIGGLTSTAIKQLKLQRFFSKEEWEKFYMGDDGKFTMYVDLVKKQYAKSSTSTTRYQIKDTDTAQSIFNAIRNETA